MVTFVLCLIFLSADFWTVKNVSGRLLVGLRWWNEVAEDGSSAWRFEALDAERQRELDPFEQRVFWGTLYGAPCVWAVLGILGAVRFKLDYLLIVALALAMTGANMLGYVKASREQSGKLGTVLSGLRMAAGGAKGLI